MAWDDEPCLQDVCERAERLYEGIKDIFENYSRLENNEEVPMDSKIASISHLVKLLPNKQLLRVRNFHQGFSNYGTKRTGAFPLHFALVKMQSHPTPLEFRKRLLEIMLQAYPEEAKQTNPKGRLPLHVYLSFSSLERMEVGNNAGDEDAIIVDTLIRANIFGPYEEDSFGHQPLHLALSNDFSPNVIERILLGDPKAALQECKNKHGEWKNIFWIIENNYSDLEQEAIIDVFREDLKEEDFRSIFSRVA